MDVVESQLPLFVGDGSLQGRHVDVAEPEVGIGRVENDDLGGRICHILQGNQKFEKISCKELINVVDWAVMESDSGDIG